MALTDRMVPGVGGGINELAHGQEVYTNLGGGKETIGHLSTKGTAHVKHRIHTAWTSQWLCVLEIATDIRFSPQSFPCPFVWFSNGSCD